MKKIAIITTHPIQYQIPLFRELTNNKIITHVFYASSHGIKSLKKDKEFNVKFNWDIGSNMLKGYKSFFSNNQKYDITDFRLSFNKLSFFLKKEKYDALIILGWNNLHYLKAFWYAKKYNIKTILRVETNLKSNIFFLKRYIKQLILIFFFSHFDYFLSIGKLNKIFYLHHGVNKKKIFNAPYFVDNNFFKNKKNHILKKKLNLSKKKIILFVGKLIDRKKPLDFLKLASLSAKKKNVHFIIIGDGNLKTKCVQFINKKKLKNITIVGFLNQKKLAEYYSIGDLLIMTSDYETWGLTINEAMAANLPVISTDKCGAHIDLIKNYKTGFVYPSGDILNLYKKVNLILNNRELLIKMKKNTKKIISKFTVKKTIDSIKIILDEKKK
jgi:glycosyltransferase involved in cell wall biosynthesis